MKSLKQKYLIKSSIENVWDALTNAKTIEKWGGGPAKMKPKEDFNFKLWDGDIFGKNIEVTNNKKLVQEWYGGKWKQPSRVTFILNGEDKKTVVELTHTDIPDEEFNGIEQGWKDYYMNPLKKLVEEN